MKKRAGDQLGCAWTSFLLTQFPPHIVAGFLLYLFSESIIRHCCHRHLHCHHCHHHHCCHRCLLTYFPHIVARAIAHFSPRWQLDMLIMLLTYSKYKQLPLCNITHKNLGYKAGIVYLDTIIGHQLWQIGCLVVDDNLDLDPIPIFSCFVFCNEYFVKL